MTGVKGFIRDSIPPHWEEALKDHKCLGSFIEQFYQAIAKPKNRNKYYYKVSIMQARHDIKNKVNPIRVIIIPSITLVICCFFTFLVIKL